MLFESFFESEYVKEVNDPQEFRYMKILRFKLKLLGAWPGISNCTKYEIIPAYCLICVKAMTWILSLLYIRIHSSSLSFFDIRLATLPLKKRYRDLVKRFITQVNLCYFKNDSVNAMKTYMRVHKKSYFFTIYINLLLVGGFLLFNSSPLFNNYKNGKLSFNNKNNISFEFAVYYALPFNTVTNLKGYITVAIFNWFACYACSSIFCVFDLLLFIMVFHIGGHFEILIHYLKNFPKPATMPNGKKKANILTDAHLYSEEELIEIENKLKHCINYHRLLIKFMDKISNVFGPMLFFYNVFHQVSGCILLLEISQLNPKSLIRYGPLCSILFHQLIQLSFIIESIGTVTGQLKDAVYQVPWEYMDTKNRKTLMIFLINIQEPLHINALGLAKVGVTSMAAILKTSFSYFAFLRSVAE